MRQDGRAQRAAFDHLADTARVLSGRALDVEARRQFSRYLELLLLWNRAQNLTGFGSPPEIVRGLFEDSLLFLPLLPDRPLRVVDIGAGAGIPGMPLRIIDERIEVTLIESKRKRVSFLKTLRRELGLENSVMVEEGRAEALVSEVVRRDGAFDVAVARAVGNLEASGSDRAALPEARRCVHRLGSTACSARRVGCRIAWGMAHFGLP